MVITGWQEANYGGWNRGAGNNQFRLQISLICRSGAIEQMDRWDATFYQSSFNSFLLHHSIS
jgi:hypothetical protein